MYGISVHPRDVDESAGDNANSRMADELIRTNRLALSSNEETFGRGGGI